MRCLGQSGRRCHRPRRPVPLDRQGGLVYRHDAVSLGRSESVNIRIVYRDGTIAGRRVAMNVDADRAVMRTASTSITSDGFNIAEARLTNAEQVAAVEIGGQNFPVGADGRLTYFLNRSETSGASRLPVRVIYSNGLSADTWMPVVDGVGGAIALPRAPKQVALMIGNSQYTGGA